MTLAGQQAPVAAWDEPEGLKPRGTLVVIPGRGEQPALYERFGRRLAADAYRVRVVTDPAADADLARAQVAGFLAGLPTADASGPAGSWDEELDTRTACPTHRGQLATPDLRRGALYEPYPDGWLERADLSAVQAPILGVHGAGDPVSPLPRARARYGTAAAAELVSITGGRHDALNDQAHRTVAATVVLFLERIRQEGGSAPIAVRENLGASQG